MVSMYGRFFAAVVYDVVVVGALCTVTPNPLLTPKTEERITDFTGATIGYLVTEQKASPHGPNAKMKPLGQGQ